MQLNVQRATGNNPIDIMNFKFNERDKETMKNLLFLMFKKFQDIKEKFNRNSNGSYLCLIVI